MTLQLRKKESRGASRDPYYCPERDLAHIGPGMMRQAMAALDEQWWEPWFREFAEYFNISEADMAPGAGMFANAFNDILSPSCDNPTEALDKSGFSQLPPPIQMAFYSKIGQIALLGIWVGIRDINAPSNTPPPTIEDLLDALEDVAKHFACGGFDGANPGPTAAGETDAPEK